MLRNQLRTLAAPLLGAFACLALLAGSAGAAQDGINVAFVGSVSQNAHVESLIDRLHPAWVRVFVNWNAIETAPGVYNRAQIEGDQALFAALPRGTKVDVVLDGTPAWAGGATPADPPANDQTFGAFANYVANAFGQSVAAYEIWNEEDGTTQWNGTPAQYVGLLAAAYPAIKAANPNATVILGGLGANDYPYLQQLYQAGAAHYFDAVGVHTDDACSLTSPYAFAYNPGTTQINRWSFLGFTTVHSVMTANGDGAKPIYMTEIGWSTSSATCSAGSSAGKRVGGVSEKVQAKFLRQAYHCLARPQYSYVTAAMWFDMADFGQRNVYYDRYGLMSYGLVPKPSFTAFANESAHGDTLKGSCGNFAGPALHLSQPYNGERYSGALQITVSAKRNGKAPGDAVGQIELMHDGSRILYFNKVDAHYANGVLSGTIDWQGARYLSLGPHVITAKVNNANGVSSTIKVTVIHVRG
jgi:hypothetical protein